MFDGFGNTYLGETNLEINEGDHGLIETLPKVSLVKKLVSNEEIWAQPVRRYESLNGSLLNSMVDWEEIFGTDDFLLDKDFDMEYT